MQFEYESCRPSQALASNLELMSIRLLAVRRGAWIVGLSSLGEASAAIAQHAVDQRAAVAVVGRGQQRARLADEQAVAGEFAIEGQVHRCHIGADAALRIIDARGFTRLLCNRPPDRARLLPGEGACDCQRGRYPRPAMNPLYETMATTVFERMSLAAAARGAINLGQGFPDFGWSPAILAKAAEALATGSNQYAPSRGLPVLREAVAAHYGRHFGKILTAENVCVTSGATEAIAAALLAVVSPGDEVIVMTPAYDAYAPLIRRAGGVVREVALRPPSWRIEGADLAAAIGPQTRAILLNNPHNPTGRLFDRAELDAVAALANAHDLVVINDEVWEHVLLEDSASRRSRACRSWPSGRSSADRPARSSR